MSYATEVTAKVGRKWAEIRSPIRSHHFAVSHSMQYSHHNSTVRFLALLTDPHILSSCAAGRLEGPQFPLVGSRVLEPTKHGWRQ